MPLETPHIQTAKEIPSGAKLFFVTSKGSEYYLLSDGKTQRFKAAKSHWEPPHDIIVFVPDYGTLKSLKPAGLSDSAFETMYGENTLQLNQIILELIHDTTHYFGVVNEKQAIKTNAQKETSDRLFVIFELKTDSNDQLIIPVSAIPKVGYSPLDARYYVKDGKNMLEKHLGHKIIRVVT